MVRRRIYLYQLVYIARTGRAHSREQVDKRSRVDLGRDSIRWRNNLCGILEKNIPGSIAGSADQIIDRHRSSLSRNIVNIPSDMRRIDGLAGVDSPIKNRVSVIGKNR